MNLHLLAFVKNAGTLVTGTAFAQILPVLLLPVISRIYSPDEFSGLVVFVALASILSAISNFRLQLAIVQTVEDRDAIVLMLTSIASGFVLILITTISYYFFRSFGDFLFKYLGTELNLLILLLTIPAFSFQQACSYFLLRNEQFSVVAISKALQGGLTVLFQIIFGLLEPSATSLILAYFLGICITSAYLVFKVLQSTCISLTFSWAEFGSILAKFKLFPLLSTPAALLDIVSVQMPVYAFSKFQNAASTGAFGLTMRILSAPSSLVAASVSQALLKAVADADKRMGLDFTIFVGGIFSFLAICYLPIAIIISFSGTYIFTFVFGSEWSEAGMISEMLVWAVMIRFAVSPVSSILSLKKYLIRGVIWQGAYFISLCIVVYYFGALSVSEFVWAFVFNEILMYSIYLLLILASAKQLSRKSA